jgi:hypothetical protein
MLLLFPGTEVDWAEILRPSHLPPSQQAATRRGNLFQQQPKILLIRYGLFDQSMRRYARFAIEAMIGRLNLTKKIGVPHAG